MLCSFLDANWLQDHFPFYRLHLQQGLTAFNPFEGCSHISLLKRGAFDQGDSEQAPTHSWLFSSLTTAQLLGDTHDNNRVSCGYCFP